MTTDLNKMTVDELRDRAARNSQKWHTVGSKEAQNELHNENVEINKILDARTGSTSSYDAPSGTWKVSGGSDYAANLERQLAEQSSARNNMVSEYQNLYSGQNNAYQQLAAQQQAAQAAAVQKAVNSLESRKASTDAQYADLFRQLYVDRMRGQKNMDQQLAAGGVTGGAAETTRLGYDTAYEDALRQGEQGRIDALGLLDQAIADARLTGDLESANVAAAAAKEQADAYADTLKYLINRQDKLDAQQEAYTREDAQRAAAYAQQLAKEQREAEEKAEEEAKKALVPRLTYAQVRKEMDEYHNYSPEILAMLRYYQTYGE